MRIDPFESGKDDLRFAYMAQIISNLMISAHGGKNAKLREAKDFLIDWDFEKEPDTVKQNPEEMKSILMSLTASVKRKQKKKKDE